MDSLSLGDLQERLVSLREQEMQESLNLAAVKGAIQQVEMFIAELEGSERPLEVVKN